MQEVAKLAGVSTALVSLVMRQAPNVSDRRRKLVLDAAADLGYRPNVLARNLASRRTQTIGVVVNDLHNPFFAEIVDGIQDAADKSGYRLLLGNGSRSKQGEARAVETFLQFRVDGIVLVGPRLTIGAIEAAAADAAISVVGRATRHRALDTVNSDEAVGAKLAVEHLIGLGHKRIAHISGGTGAGSAPRRRGYEATMKAHGLAQHITVTNGDFNEGGGYTAAKRLLDIAIPNKSNRAKSNRAKSNRPTAIFAANDQSAAGALDYIEASGLSVPDDISLVGYDNTALAAMHHMSLTTINQPRAELGRIAATLLFDRLGGRTSPVHHVAAPTLVVRRSSGPPHGGSPPGDPQ
jgi:DNA-binding LacI/PurR family transcriptional regulator